MAMRIIGFKKKGGFATHCLVEHEKFLVDIEGLDAADVVPHACSGITVLNALEKLGPLRDGEWMAIMGCGGLGMNAIAIASAMGFQNIIAVDIDDAKLKAARDMGAVKVMNGRSKDAVQELQALADGRLMGVIDTFGGDSTGRIAVRNSPQLRKLIAMVRDGKVKQMPIERRPLSEINQAMDDLEGGKVTGRIVFLPDHSET
ncbi:MAG: zinc-binding dehydrogenase [Geminicoccaceae bacterium]